VSSPRHGQEGKTPESKPPVRRRGGKPGEGEGGGNTANEKKPHPRRVKGRTRKMNGDAGCGGKKSKPGRLRQVTGSGGKEKRRPGATWRKKKKKTPQPKKAARLSHSGGKDRGSRRGRPAPHQGGEKKKKRNIPHSPTENRKKTETALGKKR